jgi:tRNA modification GTPase
VRISGPDVLACLNTIFQPNDERESFPPPHLKAISGSLRLTGMNAALPCDLFFWPEKRSYTGQIVAELHVMGCPPILEALLKSLCTSGARMAEPGEFTLRAFLSGRIDLTQAEAVLGVIDSADPRELQVAVAQLAGGLASPLHGLREALLDLLAHLEAGFDFADEDLPFITTHDLQNRLACALENVNQLKSQMKSRTISQAAVRAVLYGLPNTGKSSLFNALTRKEHALVSDLPGTTRDYLTAELDFDGRKCQLIDTAGFNPKLAQTANIIHAPDLAAQKTSSNQLSQAHLRILCLDATRPLDEWEQTELQRSDDLHQIAVWTKIDALSRTPHTPCAEAAHGVCLLLSTSSLTGEGLEILLETLRQMAHSIDTVKSDVVAGTAARCRQSIHNAGESLQNARELAQKGTVPFSPTTASRRCPENRDSPHVAGEELIAAEIRTALEELGKVVGAVYTDDVLDRIFSRFCVGK